MIQLLFLLILFPKISFAQEWKINSDHSEIFFRVPYLNISEVTGRFNSFSGSAELGEKEAKHVFLQIYSSAIDTGNRLRDGHLKSS
jgi:polyisoprenoid-binding protein YceI